MSTARNFLIKEFPQDGRQWRLEWINGLKKNPNIPEEFVIIVVLRPLRKGVNGNLTSIADAESDRDHFVQIGIGQLPVLELGSIWINGVKQPGGAGEVKGFEVFVSTTTVGFEKKGVKSDKEMVLSYGFHKISGAWRSNNVLAKVNEGPTVESWQIRELIIPAFELIRFYYACSTQLAHLVFSGILKSNPESVFDLKTSRIDKITGNAFIKAEKRFSDSDLWVIARICFS